MISFDINTNMDYDLKNADLFRTKDRWQAWKWLLVILII